MGKASLDSRVALQLLPAEAWIGVRARNEDDRVVVEVEDTRPGISPKMKERIFDPYRRFVEDGGRLSGLGLALAKTILELHGGEIWVESEPGRRSR